MLKVILIMAFGIFIGYFVRNRKRLVQVLSKLTIWLIFLLLFFMGISVGSNAEVMQHIDTIGLQGLQLALVSIAGSVLLSWVLYLFVFKPKDGTNEG